MGTRSLTVVVDNTWPGDKEPREIMVMYRQFDGYPSGHGKELKDFLSGIRVVNGIPVGDGRRMANGGGCLAAQIVAHFKTGCGGIYIYPAGHRDCGEDYTYTVTATPDEPIRLRVNSGGEDLYDGPVEAFDPDFEATA